MHSSLFHDVIRQGSDKLFHRLDTIGIMNKCVSATEELSHGKAICWITLLYSPITAPLSLEQLQGQPRSTSF